MARKILLADDSVTAQNMGRKILTDAGYEVVTVNNGSAALKKIAECKPAVVVLDVYMPGYSGLEVCSRIKEGRDTAGIPVLLTVGKLEPFRQEEARKAHADAFIIKPFEATELLAALGKLEAKAGPQAHTVDNDPPKAAAEPQRKSAADPKNSKHVPTTMARYEREVADGAPKFGDQESGWKARLTMPGPGSKHEEESDEQELATLSTPIRESDRSSSEPAAFSISSSSADPESLQGLPSDVTADELAAIAAAAAVVGGNHTSSDSETTVSELPAPVAESKSIETAAPAVIEASVPCVDTPAVMESVSAGPVSAQVEAVLSSFAAASASPSIPEMKIPERSSESAQTVVAVSDGASLAVGRWVAEEVPVEPAESSLILEREMQKAFAAFAAAEHSGSYVPGPAEEKRDEPAMVTMAPPSIGTPTPFAITREETEPDQPPSPATESVPAQDSQRSDLASPPATPFAPIAAEEPKHAVVAFGEPHPFGAEKTPEPVAEENTAAGSQPETAAPEIAASVQSEWHELRPVASADAAAPETGNNGKFSDFKTDTPTTDADELASKLNVSAMAAAASGDSSSTSSAVDSSLSSIVDNMLAELKPKLMAELAKKLDKK